MKLNRPLMAASLMLAACSHDPAGIRIAHEVPPAPPAAVVASRSEPVFYNGKTYQVSIAPAVGGGSSLSISGMGPAQSKDASALSTSTLHHFTCKDSQRAVLNGAPTFDGSNWKVEGRCNLT